MANPEFWLLFVINFVVGTISGYFIGWYGIIISIPISVVAVWHFAKEYNAKLMANPSTPS